MLTNIDITKIFPHTDNPRQDLGDLTELAESIKTSGVLQNLTVIPQDVGLYQRKTGSKKAYTGDYTVIIGHRRLAAAKLAELKEVPCVITHMDMKTQVATMLLENMQRSDLTVYEQAHGFQMMLNLGESVDGIAQKTGFSQSTVRRRLKMTELNQDILKEVSGREISLLDFDRLAQIEDTDIRNVCLKDIGTGGFNQTVETHIRRQMIKKNLPFVKAQIKSIKAKKIERSATYSGKYDRIGETIYINKWVEGTDLVASKEKRPLFYYIDEDYGRLDFYAERQKAKPIKRSAAEIEREKRVAATWEAIKEKIAVFYTLRSDFIKGISLNSRNTTAILKGAAAVCILKIISYVSSDDTLLYSTLGMEQSGYDPNRVAKALEALNETSAKGYPAIIYAAFGDNENLSYASGMKSEFPKHEVSHQLNAIYDWLVSLGYEMSEDEKALQDGTHDLYTQNDKPEQD